MFKYSWLVSFLFTYASVNVVLTCDNGLSTNSVHKDNSTKECDINPDAFLTPPQIIRRHGYPSESHVVETRDGYLLTMHRIPGGKNGAVGKQPVFIQHGLLSSSADFVATGNQSLAFILADLGYDVWLGNARGNTYSRAHVSLRKTEAKFWNFSWHEMGVYDLPAEIQYISNVTDRGGEIIYIGHSMGTTMYFVFASVLPEFASKHIKAMVGMGPVTYLKDIKSPVRYLAPFIDELEWIEKHMGLDEFLPSNKLIRYLSYDCVKMSKRTDICTNIIFAICGFDRSELDPDLLPVILNNAPAGTSTKTIIHYGQLINDPQSKFKCFDYGKQNIIIYGTPEPPVYNISKIKPPTYLMYAPNDWLATPTNVKRLAQNLTNHPELYEVPMAQFNHIDFLWAKDAPKLVYKLMVQFMKRYALDVDEEKNKEYSLVKNSIHK